ncbi:Protein of unknown function [Anaerocolumna jejuensis DSM 15929]|jgi:hypothetical protein|uniref:DUF4238 domain-containing protein n=1 Tax=Anaerocolumna jejuensis DSM 15929 TaxID=1121322 RepID=A0A1M6PHJ5_9FIRM|nr:DUF4238 domain-containing protein [Anaerocolumna jejuensis]SHK07416.1 Protein of unknown function [Anaerocolumna jejuensis DSM 15929]
MNQTTKKQHYIWRNYLAPWTSTNSNKGAIQCLRGNKIFSVSLMNIAHENYFYGVKELTKFERYIINEMAINRFTGIQREIGEQWLNLYCAPFDLVDQEVSFSYSLSIPVDKIKIKSDQEFKNWNIEFIEKLHCQIEATGIQYLEQIRKNDISFWENEESRDKFSFYICNQYFRTKRIRDSIIMVFTKGKNIFENFKDVRPENMWIPLTLIFASNMGVNISHNFSAVLLQAKNSSFIVGDQPVINTYSTFDAMTSPDDVELFYPVTPHKAILLTKKSKYKSGQKLVIDDKEVEKYNMLEVNASWEQIFAKERVQLEKLKNV